jgi:MFS family permease
VISEPDQNGEPWISRGELQRGLRVSIFASAFGLSWVAIAMGMPVTMLMECLGGSAVAVGMIVTIQQLATLAQLPAALMAERLAYRKPLWFWSALVHRLIWVVPALLILLPEPRVAGVRIAVLVAIGISSLLGQIGVPMWFSWMGDLVPERLRSKFWGIRQSVVMTTHLLAVMGAGWLLDAFPDPRADGGSFTGYVIIFTVGTLLGVLDILIHAYVPEPQQAQTPRREPWWQRCLIPLRESDFRWTTVAFGVWMFSIGLVGSFGILFLTRKFNVNYTELSITMVSASLGTAVAGLLWARVMELMGARTCGVVTMLLAPLCGIVWFLMRPETVTLTMGARTFSMPQPVLLLLVVNVLAGALYSGAGLAQVNLLADVTRRERRTVSMAVHWTFVGLMGALGPILGGVLTDLIEAHPMGWQLPGGGSVGFMHVLVLVQVLVVWFVAAPALLRVKPCGRHLPLPVLAGNPLRAAGLLMGLSSLTRAATATERVKALRKLGKDGDDTVLADLEIQLEDPDPDVREAAVSALGDLGSEGAVDLLSKRLDEEQEHELAPQLARALRKASSPAGVDALVRKLDSDDRETQVESARALGDIGDRRAVGSLKTLLQSSGDEKVATASGEALAKLGEFEAVYDMLPRMRCAKRRALRRSLAVAMADLLVSPGEFYTMLAQEERDPGVVVDKLLRRLQQRVRTVVGEENAYDARAALVSQIGTLYEQGEIHGVCEGLCKLVDELAAVVCPGGEERHDYHVTARLMDTDASLGIAHWFMRDLVFWARADISRIDTVDLLLGIYVLAGREPERKSMFRRRSVAG